MRTKAHLNLDPGVVVSFHHYDIPKPAISSWPMTNGECLSVFAQRGPQSKMPFFHYLSHKFLYMFQAVQSTYLRKSSLTSWADLVTSSPKFYFAQTLF